MVGSIVVVGALTHCALLHSICDLKVALINVQHCLIWELLIYDLKLGHNVMEITKNISCVKGDGTLDHKTINQMVKKNLLLRLQEPQ